MRKFLPSIVLSGLAGAAVVASLAAQVPLPPPPGAFPSGGPGFVAAGQNPGQVPPLVTPTPSATIQPTTMAITAPQADVYSGPSANFYVTGRLRGGERVVVLGESKRVPGWLEILPPQGSMSWIDARFVKTVPGINSIGVVDTTDPKETVPVCPGSTLANVERNVEIARVARGTQVVIGGPAVPGNGTTWYPIYPTATEVRYIPADAVRGGGVYASNGNPYGPSGNPYGPNSYGGNPYQPTGYASSGYSQQNLNPGAVAPVVGFVALSQQADTAFTAGNMTRAYQLYNEALGQASDPAWQQYLRNQIARSQGGPAQPTQPGAPSNWMPTGAPTIPASMPSAPTSAVGVPGQKQWSGWGTLRSTTFTHEGQPMYLLETTDSSSPIYVTTAPGTSLAGYVGQTINVYGTTNYRNDSYIRMTYMLAENFTTPNNGVQPMGR